MTMSCIGPPFRVSVEAWVCASRNHQKNGIVCTDIENAMMETKKVRMYICTYVR